VNNEETAECRQQKGSTFFAANLQQRAANKPLVFTPLGCRRGDAWNTVKPPLAYEMDIQGRNEARQRANRRRSGRRRFE
jgi:hypothetical protein